MSFFDNCTCIKFLWVTTWGIYGLCFGSFINVLIYRLPRNMSLMGRSTCPKSGKSIKWHDNIPILSFIFLKGKGRESNQAIGMQYPLIEALACAGFTLHALLLPMPQALMASLILAIAIPVIVIDAIHKLVPQGFVLAGVIGAIAVAALSTHPHNSTTLAGSLGAALPPSDLPATILLPMKMLGNGFTACGIMYAIGAIAEGIFKRPALGLGDVTLAIFIGLTAGVEGFFNILIAGATLSLLLIPVYRRIPPPCTINYKDERISIQRLAANTDTNNENYISNLAEKLQCIIDRQIDPSEIPFGPGLITATYLHFITGFEFKNLVQNFIHA